ncbi:hypothetical protein B0J14DRAFT_286009 [Halenospora varia]|nr:hypothetical protein B0J14DRAFT_286009 [Halenospora varia]
MTFVITEENSDEFASSPGVQVEEHGPTIMAAGTMIGNIIVDGQKIETLVDRANEQLLEHRDWLATNLPRLTDDDDINDTLPSSILPTPSSSSIPLDPLITPPPSLESLAKRQILDCNSSVQSAVSSALQSASFQASIEISGIQAAASRSVLAAQQSASASIASVQSSANAALISASNSAQDQIASAQASANGLVASVSTSANAAIASASSALASVQVSASAAVSSANLVASNAQATATFAISQAQASISNANSAAATSIQNTKIEAQSNLRFALVITFSILGSSLLSILIYYLCTRRERRKRQERMVEEVGEKIANEVEGRIRETVFFANGGGEKNGGGMGMGGIPVSARRSQSHDRRSRDLARDTQSTRDRSLSRSRETDTSRESEEVHLSEFPLPANKTSWGMQMEGGNEKGGISRPRLVRKKSVGTLLEYDASRPDQPPVFRSYSSDNLSTVPSTPNIPTSRFSSANPQNRLSTIHSPPTIPRMPVPMLPARIPTRIESVRGEIAVATPTRESPRGSVYQQGGRVDRDRMSRKSIGTAI